MTDPVIMVCDGCECLFPEEKLTATDDGRALLCRGCHDQALDRLAAAVAVSGAAADYAASAGAQVAREQATDRADDSVTDHWQGMELAALEAVDRAGWGEATAPAALAVAVEGVAEYLRREAKDKGAEAISDLLTMLGVNPDERPEHGGPTTAETLALAVIQAVTP